MLTFILLCLLVGAIVGFLAGLFGIGGGLVIVPTLVYLLPMIGIRNFICDHCDYRIFFCAASS